MSKNPRPSMKLYRLGDCLGPFLQCTSFGDRFLQISEVDTLVCRRLFQHAHRVDGAVCQVVAEIWRRMFD